MLIGADKPWRLLPVIPGQEFRAVLRVSHVLFSTTEEGLFGDNFQ